MTEHPVSLAAVALGGRCPRCGRGAIFRGLLEIRPACEACGLDLSAHDVGDGAAMAGVFIIGALTVIAAIIVEVRYEPPLWLHAVIWPAVVLPFSVALIRVAKALLVGLGWRYRRDAT